MTPTFEPPPTPAQLTPVKLHRTTVDMKARLRARGLLGGVYAELEGQDLVHEAEALVAALRSDKAYKPSAREKRRFGMLVVWMQEKGWTDELDVVRSAVAAGRIRLTATSWWYLMSAFFDDHTLGQRFAKMEPSWRGPTRERLRLRMGGCPPSELHRIPDFLADKAVRGETSLLTVGESLELSPASRLSAAVWARLMGVSAAPWIASHCLDEIREFVTRYRHLVGLVGRQLLEPPYQRGLQPSDVGANTPMFPVVQLISENLPRAPSSSPRKLLGADAELVIRWWKTQRDLEKFFQEWHSLPDRRKFWRGYVRHIEDIALFKKSAQALAMLVNGYWYVEFGNRDNACWRYTPQEWKRLRREKPEVERPQDLKGWGRTEGRRTEGRWIAHSGSNWQYKFTRWIGLSPDP